MKHRLRINSVEVGGSGVGGLSKTAVSEMETADLFRYLES
jgi:hypothetical protein